MSGRMMLSGERKELIEKNKVRRRPIEFSSMGALVNVSYYVQAICRKSPRCEAFCPMLVTSIRMEEKPKAYIYRKVPSPEVVPAACSRSVGCGSL
jgi:hypothetical protein